MYVYILQAREIIALHAWFFNYRSCTYLTWQLFGFPTFCCKNCRFCARLLTLLNPTCPGITCPGNTCPGIICPWKFWPKKGCCPGICPGSTCPGICPGSICLFIWPGIWFWNPGCPSIPCCPNCWFGKGIMCRSLYTNTLMMHACLPRSVQLGLEWHPFHKK